MSALLPDAAVDRNKKRAADAVRVSGFLLVGDKVINSEPQVDAFTLEVAEVRLVQRVGVERPEQILAIAPNFGDFPVRGYVNPAYYGSDSLST